MNFWRSCQEDLKRELAEAPPWLHWVLTKDLKQAAMFVAYYEKRLENKG